MQKKLLVLLILLLSISCSPKSQSGKQASLLLADIFSIRPQKVTTYVGLIQLKEAALLAEAEIIEGKAVIEKDKKDELIKKQDEVMAALNKISPEIKILARYKLVLNAIAFTAPSDLLEKIGQIEGVNQIVESSFFARPIIPQSKADLSSLEFFKEKSAGDLNQHNTATFIGADKLYKKMITGAGMRVGIIDSGIDYTHAMLGGPGDKDLYKTIDPLKENNYFPNEKVVGGVDFVGSDFSPNSLDPNKIIPKRDLNPIDESGHGTHVSGTVAGIGDGINTYSGIAREAKLYALKVFGKDGGTSDVIVIQALEYAADPTEMDDPKNRLDVVNLSLGGGFGKPKILYSLAIKNLTRAGTLVVASAGNSGDTPYIVGAPSTAEDALSVAAAIDDMPQNILIPAVSLKIGESEKLLEAIEGSIGTKAAEGQVKGSLVYLGNGAGPISDEVKNALKGKIALMDRGAISFVAKCELAVNLGAIGLVTLNNIEGRPIQMGGDKKFPIPAVMLSLAEGNEIKEALKKDLAVEFNFSPGKTINRDDLIDAITEFSSRGPRSIDSLIKPEIVGPGANIISAEMGSGTAGVQMSGTSMSGPHLAGAMALLRQAFPKLTAGELKAKILNNSKILMKEKNHIPVSLQGAGRVQLDLAYKSEVLVMPATLSLGEVAVSSHKTISKAVIITNFKNQDIRFTSTVMNGKNVEVSVPSSFVVKANSRLKLNISFSLKRASDEKNNIETDGFITFSSESNQETINLPFLAIINKVSHLHAFDLITLTNSPDDQVGTEVRLTLENKGKNDGDALVFNLLSTDERKPKVLINNISKNTSCDLEAAGIRVVEKRTNDIIKKVLQVGVKLYDPLTIWQPCDISLQIDSNGDGLSDLELVGIKADYIGGINVNLMASFLLDAKEARAIRKAYEVDPQKASEDYVSAIIDTNQMKFYDHSNVAVIETDISKIPLDKKGEVGIKLAVTNLDADDNADDFLLNHEKKWQKINLSENAFAFYDMPEILTVKSEEAETLSMKRGAGKNKLLVLYPHNPPAVNDVFVGQQSEILNEKFRMEN